MCCLCDQGKPQDHGGSEKGSQLGRRDFLKASTATALGAVLMSAVGRIVPVVPVPLIATVFARNPARSLSALELKAEVERLLEDLERSKAHVYVPRSDFDYAVNVGLRTLLLRHLVAESDGLYAARESELPLLRYYANSIAHLML